MIPVLAHPINRAAAPQHPFPAETEPPEAAPTDLADLEIHARRQRKAVPSPNDS